MVHLKASPKYFVLLLFFFDAVEKGANCFVILQETMSHHRGWHPTTKSCGDHHSSLNAYLTCALESSESPRDDSPCNSIQWKHPIQLDDNGHDLTDHSCSSSSVPLYPLPATYLPNPMGNCTLRNTERRNIQMALDVTAAVGGRFCTVLRAVDTGRLATVGTILRVLDEERHTTKTTAQEDIDASTSSLQRIVLTCVPECTVDVVRIENPVAAQLDHRMRHPTEYLRAVVRNRPSEGESLAFTDSGLRQDIANDYNTVRMMYINDRVATGLRSFSVEKLAEALPEWTSETLSTVDKFWQAVDTWKSLCETVREARQAELASDRNELLVEAAMAKGGPLQLPIHVSDLHPDDRQRVRALEVDAQCQWKETKLNTCLDFQVLMEASTHADRLQHFGCMVLDERKRLEIIQQSQQEQQTVHNAVASVVPSEVVPESARKGAWFDDSFW